MTELRTNGNKDFIFDGGVEVLQVNEEDISNNLKKLLFEAAV